MAIDTRQVLNRRQLRYESLDDFLGDADRLATGNSRTLGNWTLAQIFDHLARWFHMAVEGTDVRVPRWVQFMLWQWRKRSLSMPSKPGFKIPSPLESVLLPEEGFATDRCPYESGACVYSNIGRWRCGPACRADNPEAICAGSAQCLSPYPSTR